MAPLELWHGEVILPPLPDRKLNIGGNLVLQRVFPATATRARIEGSPHKGHFSLVTDLRPPYDRLFLREKGARRIDAYLPVVIFGGEADASALPNPLQVQWDTLGELERFASTPDGVLERWKDKFSFRVEDETSDGTGLRLPQMGALHAICAHFAVGEKFDPATVVLPTGTGKTETMLATLVYRRLKRVLVIVPSVSLRSQIGRKFASLGVLPELEIVPREIARPRVAFLSTGIRSHADARALVDQSNVIVALPDTLKASSAEAVRYVFEQCTDLIVDEAHHVTAATWNSIREHFLAKHILQFTATPFRRDGKRVDGKIIFNYKLGDAQAAGYYRTINLRTVEEYGDPADRDEAIAAEAVLVLRQDRQNGFDHLLMARTKTKERAEDVAAVYRRIAPELKTIIVYSGPGRTIQNREALNAVLDRGPEGARIVVCVDMLGEGFDLSNLKIAALHDTHKSLAVTLQFIGRFTRKGTFGKVGEATVVTNIADPDAEAKLAELYSEGAEWDRIIKRLSASSRSCSCSVSCLV